MKTHLCSTMDKTSKIALVWSMKKMEYCEKQNMRVKLRNSDQEKRFYQHLLTANSMHNKKKVRQGHYEVGSKANKSVYLF